MFNRRCIIISFFIIILLCQNPFQVAGRENTSKRYAKGIVEDSVQGSKDTVIKPTLVVAPREMDFGAIGPSEGAKGNFILKNVGTGALEWNVRGPEGWSLLETEKLSGSIKNKPDNLKVHISSLKEGIYEGENKTRDTYLVQITLEVNGRLVSYQKRLPSGSYREMLKLVFNGGTKTIFVRFKIISAEAEPIIDIEPLRLDLGVVRPDEEVSKRIKVNNRGISVLRWRASVQRDMNKATTPVKTGRYISFLNEDVKGSGVYVSPSYLKDVIDIYDKWYEHNGYPSSNIANHVLRYRFWGTGISVFFSVEPEGGDIAVYVDENINDNRNCHVGPNERAECTVAEGLTYGPHVLNIFVKAGNTMIEGVRIFGKDVMKINAGLISIFPISGTTTRETDFINIIINTQHVNPGYYGDNILFESNGGQRVVEVSLEVIEDNIPKILDVYRYISDSDYMYTSYPQENNVKVYRKQGIAFRLFSPGTPGTTAFYRWYHAGKKLHFYSYDRHGEGKSLRGYTFEGTIGNIGTSRLTNTRELYRWFNPVTGSYFYTTDPNGEDHLKKGYRFDGIAGYVR